MGRRTLEIKPLIKARLSTDGRIKDVRADHVARYRWAARRAGGVVIDAGCNCGYGSAILADATRRVIAIDNWPEGLEFAKQTWYRPNITWLEIDLENPNLFLLPVSAVVAFEIIEHLEDPIPLLWAARQTADTLFASVPNEDVWPWEERLGPVHKRHYTKADFADLLKDTGWRVGRWWGQKDGYSPVEPGVNGRTLVVECH